MKPNLDKIKEILQVLKEDTITPKELEYFVIQILGTIKNEREKFENISQEQVDKIDKAVISIEEKANDNQLEVRQLTNKQKDAHNARMSELEGLINEFRNFEIPEPEEVDTEAIINETLARIPKVELPKEIEGEDIVDKINSLNTEPENQIDFSHIKNAPEFKGGRGGSTARNLYQLGDVNITEPTNTQVLTYDSSNNTWKNADATGGGGGTSDTAYAETPSGTINSSNVTFTLVNTPTESLNVIVLLDGVTQYNGIDYTVSGTTITFVTAPVTGSTIFAYYRGSSIAPPAGDFYELEDGSGEYLMEDGTSKYLQE